MSVLYATRLVFVMYKNWYFLETPIKFQLAGEDVPSGGQVSVQRIGEKGNALLCITPNEYCCKNKQGRFENGQGDKVPASGSNQTLYRSRGTGMVRLNHRSDRDSSAVTGVYRCCLPDGCGEEKCIEITLV